MPVVKTEVNAVTRANVAYAAALLSLSESQVYGMVLDLFAGGNGPEHLARCIEREIKKGEIKIEPYSQDTQQDPPDSGQS